MAGKFKFETILVWFSNPFTLIFLLFCLPSQHEKWRWGEGEDFCFCTHTEKSPFCFLSSALSLKEGRQQSFHFPACLPKVITHIKDEVYRPNCLKDPNTPSTGFENHQKYLIFTPKKNLRKFKFLKLKNIWISRQKCWLHF